MNFNTKFLSFLLEFWILMMLLFVIIIAKYTSWLVIPLMLCMSSTILFAVVFLFALIITVITPDGNKQNILLPLVNFCIRSNMDICTTGVELSSIEPGSILFVNYPANFIEYTIVPVVLHSLQKPTRVVLGYSAYKNASLFFDKRALLRLNKESNYEYLRDQLKEHTNSITIVYPETQVWDRETNDDIQPFRSGIFKIAQEIGKKIYLVRTSHIEQICGYITSKSLNICVEVAQSYDHVISHSQMVEMSQKI